MADGASEASGTEGAGRGAGEGEGPLQGRAVWVTGSRKGEAMALILERHGARPSVVPTVGSRPRTETEPVEEAVEALVDGRVRAGVFLTGVGARMFMSRAEGMDRREEVLAALEEILVVARSPKARSGLRKVGAPVDVEAEDPTTEGVLSELRARQGTVEGGTVLVQLHGREDPVLTRGLRELGAEPLEVPLYRYVTPDDREAIREMVRRSAAGEIYAAVFTSPPSVRGLFSVAEEEKLEDRLEAAFRGRTVVAAVGPSTGGELEDFGTPPDVVADTYTQPALAQALADFAAGERASAT